MENTNKKDELIWLRENSKFLSIRAIEKELGLPPTTIQQFAGKAERPIPEKWENIICKWIINFRK